MMIDILKQLTEKKSRLDAYRPFPKELVTNLNQWFKIELTYTSNAIEGNTLSRRETALAVEKGITVEGKTVQEYLEAINHAQAMDYLFKSIHEATTSSLEQVVFDFHRMVLDKIDSDNAGIYRHVPVRISGSTVILPNPQKVPDLMRDFYTWLTQTTDLHPAALAAQAHYRLVSIHPFVDGNGRTARLLMTFLLLQAGYPPAIIRKEDRNAYIQAIEAAQLGGSRNDFDLLIYNAVDRSLDIYLDALENVSKI